MIYGRPPAERGQLAHGHTKPRVTKSATRATEKIATAHMPATRRRAGQLICAFPSDAAAIFVLFRAADAAIFDIFFGVVKARPLSSRGFGEFKGAPS